MPIPWKRLIRFIASDGRVLYGEPLLPSPNFDLGQDLGDVKLEAKVIQGQDIYDTTGATQVTDEVVVVKKILGPVTSRDVPVPMPQETPRLPMLTVREANRKPPPFPSMFCKPARSIIGPNESVIIPKIAQDSQADYEGELCVIIGKDTKDVSEGEALSYVAAYTVGNDISSRKLQRDPKLAGSVPQWCFSKGFDTFAPLGPVLVAASEIPDPSSLRLQTRINDELRQDTGIDDLVFDIPRLISYLSTGTTLEKGSVIMTGTPGGVGAGLDPPQYLQPGTQMKVFVSEIGTLTNTVEFA
ncbi:hypothetical protein NW762_010597 [Fusarium torreyae]|uniref:Fumarylacetoacetase-like C-terminal domain-containing protein n=1 Tax=Fusarium torreyae TaxID=1237075 RepID=A0A9W8RVL0_9HYPO|nr:hypothetical protein NW762_010597 [Fusarium torreyae]